MAGNGEAAAEGGHRQAEFKELQSCVRKRGISSTIGQAQYPRIALSTLFACIVLFSSPAQAGDKTDVIYMKNGDRLTCEIKGLDSGVLHVSFDYILGTQSLNWSKVEYLESKNLFIVKTEDGKSYTGRLSMAETGAARPVKLEVVEAQGETEALEKVEVVEIDRSAETFWHRLNGEINSGVIYSKGNQTAQYSLDSSIEYPQERWSAGASFSSILSTSTGTSASTRNYGTVNALRLLPWSNWFYGGVGGFLQSSEQGINLQTTAGGGIGRYLKNTSRTRISLLGGLAWQGTKYQQGAVNLPEQNVAAAMLDARVNFFLFNQTSFTASGTLLPALSQPGRVHFTTNAGYYVKFLGDFTWNISFYGTWDNRPPSGFSGADYGTSSGLGWTFGTR